MESLNSNLEKQFKELLQCYPSLTISKSNDNHITVEGYIYLQAEYRDIPLVDRYLIKVDIPHKFPSVLPTVFVTSQKIPPNFNHIYEDGSCCLGVPIELLERLEDQPTLLFFVNEFVINYLYAVTYYAKYGAYPYGERSHGIKGILEYYLELFGVKTDTQALSLLRLIVNSNKKPYRGHSPCPCGSSIITRKCHGSILLKAIKSGKLDYYSKDYYSLYAYQQERKANLKLLQQIGK